MGASQVKENVSKDILKLELNLLRNLQVCPVDIQNEINEHDKDVLLDRINEFAITNELDERFYDYRFMNALSCLYGNLWLVDRKWFDATDLTQRYFKLKDNLSLGIEGTVFSAEKKGSNLNFIIKSTRPRTSNAIGIHEIFIGLSTTNKLRKYCPNFAYVYGGFTCGGLDIGNRKICEGPLKVPYVVYELISGDSIYKHVRAMNAGQSKDGIFNQDELMSCILQVYFALRIAYVKGKKFSHGDSHIQNIILRPLKKKMTIKYEIDGKIYYVYSSYVATLIDYGMSQIWLMGKEGEIRIGRIPRSEYSNLQDVVNLQDLYKLIGWTTRFLQNVKYKSILLDIFIGLVDPSFVQGRYQNKLFLLKTMSETKFDANEVVVRRFIEKKIHVTGFVEVFKKQYPLDEQKRIFLESDGSINSSSLPYPLLECDEKCVDECFSINEIMTVNPESQAKEASVNANLSAQHILETNYSLLRFKNNEEYKDVLERQLEEAEKNLTRKYIFELNSTIQNNIGKIKMWIGTISIPNTSEFTTSYGHNLKAGFHTYVNFVRSWTNILKLAEEAIELNNSLSISNQKSTFKQELINQVNLLTQTHKQLIVPLKASLLKLSNANAFGNIQGNFAISVINPLSDSLLLSPIQ